MAGLGVYVQIPFCASKCSFCNFSSRVAPASVFEDYCCALVEEIRNLRTIYHASGIAPEFLAVPVDTIYFGGGTPPMVGLHRLRTVLAELRRHFSAGSPVEFTVEVTPGSADEPTLAGLMDLGVNRLSIGAQTFNDQELRSVGRLHTVEDTSELVAAVRRAGFKNISLDLIAGLPYQTHATWKQTLDMAAALGPQHVSVYIFEIDEKSRLGGELLRHGTRFHAGAVPSEEFMAEAYETGRAFLRERGYQQYEISNFAMPGFESTHNLKYWRLEPFVGLGAGAHSFDGMRRWSNEVVPSTYQAKLERGNSPITEVRRLTPDEQLEEFFFVGLRETRGVDLATASRRWGQAQLKRWEPIVASLTEQRLLVKSDDELRLADGAYLVSNEIFQEFLLTSRS